MTLLPIPQNSPNFAPIEQAQLSDTTKRQYKRALYLMTIAGVNPFNRAQLQAYADGLPTSARAFLKAALKIMLEEGLTRAQAGATVENLDQIQALWHRVQAINKTIHADQPDPQRTPIWLTQAQVSQLINTAESERDRIVLSLLAGAGLRREELSELTFDALSQLDGIDLLTVRGKGDKIRRIPITAALAHAVRIWQARIGDGRIVRSVDRHGNIGASLSASGIYDLVLHYGAQIGVPDLQPHDLRRTYGRLAYQACLDIVRVQHLLGHSNSRTTERYIGLDIDLAPVQIIRNEEP